MIFVMLNTKGGVLLSSDLPLRTAAKACVLAHQAREGMLLFPVLVPYYACEGGLPTQDRC